MFFLRKNFPDKKANEGPAHQKPERERESAETLQERITEGSYRILCFGLVLRQPETEDTLSLIHI